MSVTVYHPTIYTAAKLRTWFHKSPISEMIAQTNTKKKKTPSKTDKKTNQSRRRSLHLQINLLTYKCLWLEIQKLTLKTKKRTHLHMSRHLLAEICVSAYTQKRILRYHFSHICERFSSLQCHFRAARIALLWECALFA